MTHVTIHCGDALTVLKSIPDDSVHCCVTSPPYWGLRDYVVSGQLGLEKTPEEYVSRMVEVFREVRRTLRTDGTLWVNLGDSYAGGGNQSPNSNLKASADKWAPRKHPRSVHCDQDGLIKRPIRPKVTDLKPKDLVGIPWRVAFALQADGWYLRSDIIWAKPNPMPESVTDRPTKAHEYIFLLSKSERYHYDADAIAEAAAYQVGTERKPSRGYSNGSGRNDGGMHRSGGFVTGEKRNRRSVWTVATDPYPEAHFATFPPDLIRPCILAGCPQGGTVLDPFAGSGTTGMVAKQNGCNAIQIELNPEYCKMIERRTAQECLSL